MKQCKKKHCANIAAPRTLNTTENRSEFTAEQLATAAVAIRESNIELLSKLIELLIFVRGEVV